MKGVTLTPLKRIASAKGDIYHAMKCVDGGYCGFGEAYFSEIVCGERKGWKRHNRMTLNIIVPIGEIRFIIYDDREGSNTKGEFLAIDLSPDKNYQRLTVEPGLWMAFEGIAQGNSWLLDIIPELHDDAESDKRDDIDY